MRHPHTWVLAALLVVVGSSVADAQRRCVKGIPFGNSCIAASKTCRIGSGGATRASEAPPAPVSAALSAVGEAAPAGGGLAQSARGLVAADSTRWVALPGGAVYYRASCEAAREFPVELVVSYPSEATAQRAGLRRSHVAGC